MNDFLLWWLYIVTALLGQGDPKQQAKVLEPQDLETFMDGYFKGNTETRHIPGAVFVLVKDGAILIAKGYGYANLKTKTPVLAERTLFRVGSVSKLFTVTAVLQLYERGKLRLEKDVNAYLDSFRIAEAFGKPVTIANLLTHTAGFDDRYIGIAARRESQVMPLGQYLAENMPQRVMPPGEVICSSNHGIALAGYIVQVVSGVPFAKFVDEEILKPLRMKRSSFALPRHLAPDLATGYEWKDGTYKEVPFDWLNDAPAGALAATGEDMAHFLIAHLNSGRYGDGRILEPQTLEEMNERHFAHHPEMEGMAYGFWETLRNGRRALIQTGSARGFLSLLFLLPQEKLGIFLSLNRFSFDGAGSLREDLLTEILDRYYPARKPVKAALPVENPTGSTSRRPSSRFEGTYRSCRYSRCTLAKVALLAGVPREVRVQVRDDFLLADGHRYLQVAPVLFKGVDGDRLLAFLRKNDGKIAFLCFGTDSLEKINFAETRTFHLSVLGVFVLVFGVGSFFPLLHWQPHRGHQVARRRNAWLRRAYLLAGLTSFLNVGFLTALALVLLTTDPFELTYGPGPALIIVLLIPLITIPLAGAQPFFGYLVWRGEPGSPAIRLGYAFLTGATLAFFPYLHYWNLLGFCF